MFGTNATGDVPARGFAFVGSGGFVVVVGVGSLRTDGVDAGDEVDPTTGFLAPTDDPPELATACGEIARESRVPVADTTSTFDVGVTGAPYCTVYDMSDGMSTC